MNNDHEIEGGTLLALGAREILIAGHLDQSLAAGRP